MDVIIRHGAIIVIIIQRLDVSSAATTIDIVNNHVGTTFHLQEQTFRSSHATLVAATIKHANLSLLQIPSGTDGHIGLVIATKQTTNLESIALRIRVRKINAHLMLETVVGQQLTACACVWIRGIRDAADHCTRVVQTYHRPVSHGSIVTTPVCIDDGTTQNLQIGLSQVRLDHRLIWTIV